MSSTSFQPREDVPGAAERTTAVGTRSRPPDPDDQTLGLLAGFSRDDPPPKEGEIDSGGGGQPVRLARRLRQAAAGRPRNFNATYSPLILVLTYY